MSCGRVRGNDLPQQSVSIEVLSTLVVPLIFKFYCVS